MLDTLGWWLGLSAAAEGPFVSYLATAGACSGLDQLVANPEPQQLTIDMHIAAGPGVVGADADFLPCHADHTVGRHPAADPVLPAPIDNDGRAVVRASRRSVG